MPLPTVSPAPTDGNEGLLVTVYTAAFTLNSGSSITIPAGAMTSPQLEFNLYGPPFCTEYYQLFGVSGAGWQGLGNPIPVTDSTTITFPPGQVSSASTLGPGPTYYVALACT
jgi:hypothetical protein